MWSLRFDRCRTVSATYALANNVPCGQWESKRENQIDCTDSVGGRSGVRPDFYRSENRRHHRCACLGFSRIVPAQPTPGSTAIGTRWATTMSGTTDPGPAPRTPDHAGCSLVTMDSDTLQATGMAIGARSTMTINRTAAAITTGISIATTTDRSETGFHYAPRPA